VGLHVVCVWLLSSGCGAPSQPQNPPVPKALPTQHRASATHSAKQNDHHAAGDSAPPAAQPAAAEPEEIFRPDDKRPQHDDAQLAAVGIRRFESERLRLYTDIDPEQARPLPLLTDRLYDALEHYFGPMPHDRAGTEFQMTGYLIKDLALFRETGLVPEDLPTFEHGRHRQNQFWLRDQEYDYYRAHLLLHEATHSFMTYMPDTQSPVWYLEGMAELFATHRTLSDGGVQFRIMPLAPEEVAGWGRITLIRQQFAQDAYKTIAEIFAIGPLEFFQPENYAWSWALCMFLSEHPRYGDRFLQLGREARGPDFVRRFAQEFAPDMAELAVEWQLFVVNLQYGYDVPRAAIEFRPGELLEGESRACVVASGNGWQSSAVTVEAGKKYRVTAGGQVILAKEPKPWISEPPGVSIDYFDGYPIGRLLGCILPNDPTQFESMLRVLPVGAEKEFQAPVTGTLYLRVNDAWNRLRDNHGEYDVTIQHVD